ncbi:MAG: hypothetical protein V4539_02765 [Bacteroidota bacterium]
MNDIFSFKRFGLLLKKHFAEEYKQYLLLSAGALGIMLVFHALTTIGSLNREFDTNMHEVIFIIGFIFGGAIFASLTYHFFQNNAKGIRFLELPSSHLEKLAVMFVVTQLVFFAGFLLLFYINDWLMCTFYNTVSSTPKNIPPERLPYFHANLYRLDTAWAKLSMVLFFVISSIAHFGSLAFRKIAFIKIALCVIIIGAAVLWLNFTYMRSLIPESSMPGGTFFTDSVRLQTENASRGFVLLPDNWINTIKVVLPGVLYLSFWTGSYFKLKEKQV